MRKHVLIFDDDTDIQTLCQAILRRHGYTITAEDNCHDLLDKVELASPCLILMDNNILPNGGVAAVRLLKSHPSYSHIPVALFSGSHNTRELAAAAGADFAIEKPFDLSAFLQVVHSACVPS